MELGQLKLLSLLNQHVDITDEDIEFFKSKINLYNNPLSLVPITMVDRNVYENYTLNQNISYFNNLNSKLFNNIYSNEEINIINIYMAKIVDNRFRSYSDKKIAISDLLEVNSNKEEIQYCLDELRYIYLHALVEENSPNIELINNLINILLPIEDSHNSFKWDLRI